ncbi:MAG: radical SAM protein [Magnetococcales bacterium]|nr:radical SAM protein [Magnetococcales bacterium]
MSITKLLESLKIFYNIYRRIRYFKRMYPLSTVIKQIFLFPIDYYLAIFPIKSVANVTVAITHQCNIRCEMCYFHEELKTRHILPLETFQRFIDQVEKERPCVILSGGEPFTHPNIVEMVEYAKGKGLPVQIFTNGTLMRPGVMERLVELELDYIDFTLLGDENSHDKVACASFAYGKFIENLEKFAANRGKTEIILNYTITPRALKDIAHGVELIKRLKLDGLRVQHYNYLLPNEFEDQEKVISELFNVSAGANEVSESGDLSTMADEIIRFKDYLNREVPDLPVQWAPELTPTEIKHWYSKEPFRSPRKCLFAWRGMLLDADSKLYPCSKIYLELGSLDNDDAFSIWNNPTMAKFRNRLKNRMFPACSRCCKL